MRRLNRLFVLTLAVTIISCGGKNSKVDEVSEKDSLGSAQLDSTELYNKNITAMLTKAQPFLKNELSQWVRSFTNFHPDSLRFSHQGSFEQIDYQSTDDLKKFYELYKSSLIYSPDSSQFIDLFSSGISLEKKGKKIIAITDVDQAITLCNLGTKEWKRIAFFGPSAGMEEAVWLSANEFAMAGMMHNDDGQSMPMLTIGDVQTKTLYWFEAKTTRPPSVSYESAAMKKLKVDEWE